MLVTRKRIMAVLLLGVLMLGGTFVSSSSAGQRHGYHGSHHSRARGAIIGGAAGLIGGALIGGGRGAAIGAGLGAGTGYLIQRDRNHRGYRHRRFYRRY